MAERLGLTMESLVAFRSGELVLKGIFHTPDEGERGACIVLLCPGYKSRVGQHRLYVYVARELCAQGFHVFRFDFHGLGDSEGEIGRRLFGDFWRYVQTGGFVADTIAAVSFLKEEMGVGKTILMGLCGGAITGLIAAGKDPRVDGAILINVPVMLQSGTADWFLDEMPAGLADTLFTHYLRRLRQGRSWLRLLTLKSDYRVLWRSIWSKLSRRLKIRSPVRPKDEKGQERVSPYFLSSFKDVTSQKKPILFLFSENDRQRWAFEDNFAGRFLTDGDPCSDSCLTSVIPEANHSFTQPSWRGALLKESTSWLGTHFDDSLRTKTLGMEEGE